MTAPTTDALGLVWVDELPPRTARVEAWPHAEWAAAMRERPRVWARLPLPAVAARQISGTQVHAPYRPGGSFQTEIRGRVLYARYIGTGAER